MGGTEMTRRILVIGVLAAAAAFARGGGGGGGGRGGGGGSMAPNIGFGAGSKLDRIEDHNS